MILVTGGKFTARTPQEFAEQVKIAGQPLAYGSWGVGGSAHLAGEALWNRHFKLGMTHVPYRGEAPIVNDLLSGQIPVSFSNGTLPIRGSISRRRAEGARRLRPPAIVGAAHLPTLTSSALPIRCSRSRLLGAFAPGERRRRSSTGYPRRCGRSSAARRFRARCAARLRACRIDAGGFARSLETEIATIKSVFRDLGIEQQ